MAEALTSKVGSSTHVDATTETVHAALSRLRRQQRGAVRASVLTLVVIAEDAATAQHAVAMVRELHGRHPSRLIVIQLADGADDPDGRGDGSSIDAEVSLQGEPRAEGLVWFEEILLSVRGPVRWHLDSLVNPFTLPDVPVVVWWPNTLPAPGDPLVASADRILIDTRAIGERADLFVSAARLARRLPIADLSWARLQSWRSTLAALFEGPASRPFLDQVDEVEVSGNFGARHLVAGWLMSELHLVPEQVRLGGTEHLRIRVHARHDGLRGHFSVERESHERVLRASVRIDGRPDLVNVIPLPAQWASRSLIGPLRHVGPDPVYGRALQGAVDLLDRSTV